MIRWIPFVFAFLWFGIRFITAMVTGYDYQAGRTAGVLSNLLFILVLVFVALIVHHKNSKLPPGNFLSDLKIALKAAMKYVLSVVLIMWIFYGFISPELELHRNNSFTEIAKSLDTSEEIAAIKAQNPLLADSSPEDLEKSMRERITFFTSLNVLLPASMITLSLAAVVYGLIGVFTWRRFLRPV